MARVVRFHEFGGPEVLRIEDLEIADPGAGEVRIRVKALGINRAEALIRAGGYIEQPALPARLGLEAAGVVDALGEGVRGFKQGDAVSVIPPISMIEHPAYGELAIFPANHVVRHPDTLGWEEAAALWMPFLTAYGALIDFAGLQRGDIVAITAASSSVGLAAIQIANLVGATPIALTRSPRKAAALRAAGAAHVLSTQEEGLEDRLRAISGPRGVRIVLDAVGGPTIEPLAAAMSHGGLLVSYGGLSSEPTPYPLLTALSKGLTVRGYLVHEVVGDPVRLERAKAFVTEGVVSGALAPTIARTFPLDQIVAAHRLLESGDLFGKIVVTV